jgi:hypothetical protein
MRLSYLEQANYERAAGGSLDEFDDLLTQQARQNLPPCKCQSSLFTQGQALLSLRMRWGRLVLVPAVMT